MSDVDILALINFKIDCNVKLKQKETLQQILFRWRVSYVIEYNS